MSGWIAYVGVFLLGVIVGVAGAKSIGGRGGSGNTRDPGKNLRRLYKTSPRFFDVIREDLSRPEFSAVREFAILESAAETFVSEDLRFVYYEEDIPDVKSIAAALEDGGFADEVTRGKTPIFRLRENFVEALKLL
ncbi:MAG: hypothetical protein ACR2QV_13025 [Gammaproteobacteria bacterium]